jgi:integrase
VARGTIVERSPGHWRLRVFVGRDPATGNPRQVSRTIYGTKRQAEKELARFVTEVEAGQVAADASTALGDFLDRWLDQLAPLRSPTTIRGYRTKVKRLKARLGNVTLAKLTPQQLDRAYVDWLTGGLSPTSVHHCHAVLSAALNQAVNWGIVPYAVTDRASPPPLRSYPKRIPTPATIHELVAAAEARGQPVLAAAVALAATTGMRRGELLGLRWNDLDEEAAVLAVARAVKHADGAGWVIGKTKTHQERRVSIDPFTLAVLRQHRSRAESWASEAQVAFAPDGYLLTLDPTGGTPLTPDTLTQAFRRLCERVGVEGLTLHTLRHFSASVLVASGRDVRTIAGRLGHADASTTLRVYAHMIQGRDRDAAEFIGQLMGGAGVSRSDEGRPVDAQ